jgi:hypothetical protein
MTEFSTHVARASWPVQAPDARAMLLILRSLIKRQRHDLGAYHFSAHVDFKSLAGL